jgi:hypothetical protein
MYDLEVSFHNHDPAAPTDLLEKNEKTEWLPTKKDRGYVFMCMCVCV